MSIRQYIKIALVIDGLIIIAVVIAGLYPYFNSKPVLIDADENGIIVNYTVDKSHILFPNECLTFSWEAHNISAIYFNETGVGGFDQRVVCTHKGFPPTYILRINGQDGQELSYHMTIHRAIQYRYLLLIGLPLILYLFYFAIQPDVTIASQAESTTTQRNWVYYLLYLAVVISPFLIISLYLFVRHTAHILQLMPINSDSLIVWHQAVSFARAGLNTGYYTVNEVPASSGFRFYAWGPFISILYGSVAKIIGTPLSLIVIANQIFITLATTFYVLIVRPNIKQCLLLIGVFALYTPYVIYAPSSIDVLLQLSMGIVIAVGFWKLIESNGHLSPRLRYGFGLILVLSAICVRPTWGLFLFPYAYLAFPKHWKLGIIIAGALFLVSVLSHSYFSAPYPSFRNQVLATSETDLLAAVETLINQLREQLGSFFNVSEYLVITQQRMQVGIIGGISVFGMVVAFYRHKENIFRISEVHLWGFCLFVIVSVYTLLSAVLDIGTRTELRWVAPYLLLLIVLLIAAKRHKVVLLLLAIMLVTLPATLENFDTYIIPEIDSQRHELFATSSDTLQPLMPYDRTADNPWCNTVLFDLNYHFSSTGHPVLLSFDPGIGLSWRRNWEGLGAIKSRYIVILEQNASLLENQLNIRQLRNLPNARLYLNLDADCPLPDD